MAEGWITIADKPLNKILGYQGANQILQQIRALAAARPIFLGGSRVFGLRGVAGALTLNAADYLDLELDGDKLTGFTVRARVEVRTADAGTSVTPKIRNITANAGAGTDAGVGLACSVTNQDYTGANQVQTITITLAAGLNKYRLQLTAGNANADVFGIGYVEVYGS